MRIDSWAPLGLLNETLWESMLLKNCAGDSETLCTQACKAKFTLYQKGNWYIF